jgi:hypothetical protein
VKHNALTEHEKFAIWMTYGASDHHWAPRKTGAHFKSMSNTESPRSNQFSFLYDPIADSMK